MTNERAPENSDSAKGAGMGTIARSAGWMYLFKLGERSLSLVSTVILARVLVPEDFGLVAIAMAVVGLIDLMGAFGFDVALIQRQDATRVHYDTAWTYAVIFGTTCGVLLLGLAGPVASFYGDSRLIAVLVAMAAASVVQGFENVGTIAFRKELDFRKEFRFLLAKKIVSFTVTMVLAFALRNYWALVAGTIAGKLASVWISYRAHPYRPRFALGASRELFMFSKWLFFSNLVFFLHNRAPDFILGRTVGAYTLGIFKVAAEIAVTPSTELIAPLNRAAYPAYARLAADLGELRHRFIALFGGIAVVALPVSIGLALLAEPTVRVLLGPKWLEAVPLIQLLSGAGLASALESNLFLVLLALGRPKLTTMISAAMVVVSLPSLVFASLAYGAVGAAWTYLIVSVLVQIPLYLVFYRVTGIRAVQHLATLGRPLLASAIMTAAVLASRHSLLATFPEVPPIAELAVCVTIGALVYTFALLALWAAAGRPAGAEATVLAKLRQYMSARQARGAI